MVLPVFIFTSLVLINKGLLEFPILVPLLVKNTLLAFITLALLESVITPLPLAVKLIEFRLILVLIFMLPVLALDIVKLKSPLVPILISFKLTLPSKLLLIKALAVLELLPVDSVKLSVSIYRFCVDEPILTPLVNRPILPAVMMSLVDVCVILALPKTVRLIVLAVKRPLILMPLFRADKLNTLPDPKLMLALLIFKTPVVVSVM